MSALMATKYKMNIVSIALRSYNFMFRSNSFPEREKADLLIEPYNLEGYSNTELEKAEEIFMQDIIRPMIYERLLIDKGKIWKRIKQPFYNIENKENERRKQIDYLSSVHPTIWKQQPLYQ